MHTFAEELMLFIMDEESGEATSIPDRTLGYAMAGAVLMDLLLENRIDADVERLIPIDPTPLGDAILDLALAEIFGESADAAPRPAIYWIRQLAARSEELRSLILERLTAGGVVEVDDGGFFTLSRWVARSRRYPGMASDAEPEVRVRILHALLADEIPDPRDIIIISLIHACDAFQHILSSEEYAELKERIELISRLELVSQSIIAAIRNITLAESHTMGEAVRQQGGGWPKADGWPIIGSTVQLLADSAGFLSEQYRKKGPVFELRTVGRKWVVLAGPEANLFLLRQGKHYLRTREPWLEVNDELSSTNTLPSMDGAEHYRMRSVMRAGYSRGRIESQLPRTLAIISRQISELPTDRPFAVYPTMQRFSLEQIGFLSASMSRPEYLEDLHIYLEALITYKMTGFRPGFMMNLPKVRRARRRMRLLFMDILENHTAEGRDEGDRDLVHDLLDLHHADPQFYPETDIFFGVLGPFTVGMDTVASAMSFALYCLLKHPDVLEQVRAEADEFFASGAPPEGLRQMTATQRTIQETMRLYPVVNMVLRTVSNSFDFAGYRIPAGTDVAIAMTAAHFLPEVFPDPQRFDIDRFSPERREHATPGVFSPFGLGHHSCLGQGFAQSMSTLTLASLLHRTDIAMEPPGYEVKLKHTPLLNPGDGFKVRINLRK